MRKRKKRKIMSNHTLSIPYDTRSRHRRRVGYSKDRRVFTLKGARGFSAA